MTDPIHRMQVWYDRSAGEADNLARQARERGAHGIAEQYDTIALQHRAKAERSRLAWGSALTP